MKRTSFVLTLLTTLILVACTVTPAPTVTLPVTATVTTMPTLTPTADIIATNSSPATIPPPPTDAPTLTPTTILPSETPSNLVPTPTGRIVFFWDPTRLERPGEPGPEPKENLFILTPATGLVETVLDEWLDLSYEAPSLPSVVLSPDQTLLAFTVQKDSDGDGFWDRNSIYVYNLITEDFQVAVVDHYFGIGELSWAPDNQILAYGADRVVWLVSLMDRVPKQLMDVFPDYVGFVKWSPNGNLLAIHLNATLGRIAFYDPKTGLVNEVTIDQLTSPFNMLWSPDSRWFLSNKIATSGIFLVNVAENEIVFSDDTGFGKPSWSPDGSQLAYLQRMEQEMRLFMLDVNTMTTTLSFEAEHIGNPIWSPDGHQLAVTCLCEGLNALFLIDATNLDIVQLLDGEEIQAIELLAWSPDGEWLLLSGVQADVFGLYIVHKDGHESRLLLDVPTNTRSPEQILWLADH